MPEADAVARTSAGGTRFGRPVGRRSRSLRRCPAVLASVV